MVAQNSVPVKFTANDFRCLDLLFMLAGAHMAEFVAINKSHHVTEEMQTALVDKLHLARAELAK